MPILCKKVRPVPVLFGVSILFAVSGNAWAQDATFYGALTSDYVYRGISNSDENPAGQLGVDISTDIGLFGGVWASTTDITTGNRHRAREVDYYFGYVHYFDSDWSASISLNRYTYPGGTGSVHYNYSELTGIIGFDDRIWFEVDYTDSIFGQNEAARHVEVLANWPLWSQYQLTTGMGYFDISDRAGGAYTHWQIGISRPVGWATVDLRYHDTRSASTRISTTDLADPRFVLTISAAY